MQAADCNERDLTQDVHRARLKWGDCVKLLCAIDTGSAALVILDPPYDIGVHNVGWDSVENYMPWAKQWLSESIRVLRAGGALLLYGSPERSWIARMTIMLEDELDVRLVQHLTWAYTQGGDARLSRMSRYGVRTEHLVWFEKPGGTRTFNPTQITDEYTDEQKRIALAKGVGRVTAEALDRGRPPTTLVSIPRENSRSKERRYGKHPSMKPLALCERLIRAHSNVGDLVLVPFAGSGSELIAASKLERRAIGFEMEACYVELIQRRARGHQIDLDCAK